MLTIETINESPEPLNVWLTRVDAHVALVYDAAGKTWTAKHAPHSSVACDSPKMALNNLALALRLAGYNISSWDGPLPDSDIAKAEGRQ